MKHMAWRPFVVFGVMVIVMFGLMIALGLMVGGANPMAMMFPGSAGQGLAMWGVMLFPFVGLLIMGIMTAVSFRWMAGRGGPMSRMMGHRRAAQPQYGGGSGTTLTYTIPTVNCAHCRMTIEREVGNLPGVASVSVDVETKQAVIQLVSLPTGEEIEKLLADIGYPPQSR